MTIEKFTGFTPAMVQFFRDLEVNNNKEWFDAHKPVYEKEIIQPLKALVTAMSPAMYAIDPRFEFRPHRVLSRIYRDTRFSADKTPYKTHMWMTFQRPVANWMDFPGFFMEISADNYQYGMGLYAAKKQIMEDFRSKVEYEQDHFKSITKDLTGKRNFEVQGELYKRPLQNNLDNYFQPWLQRKSVWLMKSCPIGKEVFDERILLQLTDDFSAMKNLYAFFLDE